MSLKVLCFQLDNTRLYFHLRGGHIAPPLIYGIVGGFRDFYPHITAGLRKMRYQVRHQETGISAICNMLSYHYMLINLAQWAFNNNCL